MIRWVIGKIKNLFRKEVKGSASTVVKTLSSKEPVKNKETGELEEKTVTKTFEAIAPPVDDSRKKAVGTAGVLITSPSDLYLDKCTVLDDHMIKYNLNKKKKTIDMLRPPHLLTLNVRQFMPSKFSKLLLMFAGVKYIKILTYTCQFDGEVTHDPHLDNLDEEMKLRHESLLGIKGKTSKADIVGSILAGMKKKKKWEDFIPYIVIGVIVFLFLFAFQIQPNMR